jgi:hypothetical protein
VSASSDIKTGVDICDFAITKLYQHLLEKTGSKIGFIYQDLVDDSVANLYGLIEGQKAKAENAKAEYQAPTGSEAPKSLIQQHRQKEKTRPAHSSVYEIIPPAACLRTME